MTAMQKWVEKQRGHADGVAAADIEPFAQWLTERASTAQGTAALTTTTPDPLSQY